LVSNTFINNIQSQNSLLISCFLFYILINPIIRCLDQSLVSLVKPRSETGPVESSEWIQLLVVVPHVDDDVVAPYLVRTGEQLDVLAHLHHASVQHVVGLEVQFRTLDYVVFAQALLLVCLVVLDHFGDVEDFSGVQPLEVLFHVLDAQECEVGGSGAEREGVVLVVEHFPAGCADAHGHLVHDPDVAVGGHAVCLAHAVHEAHSIHVSEQLPVGVQFGADELLVARVVEFLQSELAGVVPTQRVLERDLDVVGLLDWGVLLPKVVLVHALVFNKQFHGAHLVGVLHLLFFLLEEFGVLLGLQNFELVFLDLVEQAVLLLLLQRVVELEFSLHVCFGGILRY